jgi:outer membrane protein
LQFLSQFCCNKTAEVKEVKTAYVDTSVLMKEYTEGKILKQNIKHSLKKKEDN